MWLEFVCRGHVDGKTLCHGFTYAFLRVEIRDLG